VDPAGGEQFDAGRGGGDLGSGQVCPEFLGEPAAGREAGPETVQHLDRTSGQRLAAPLPEDRAQLVLLGEADAVVAAVQVAVGDRQQVADLPVRVVDDRVEDGQVAQRLMIGSAGEGDEVDGVVDVNPELAHAGAERPLAHYRRRHEIPAGGPADEVGRHLAASQRAGREIPERAFPRHRLVYAVGRRPGTFYGAEERHVRRADDAALDRELAALEQLERLSLPVRKLRIPGRGVVRHG